MAPAIITADARPLTEGLTFNTEDVNFYTEGVTINSEEPIFHTERVNFYSENALGCSSAIHEAIMAALEYPPEKKFQRFIGLETEDFIYSEDRGPDYTIIEISMFDGRSEQARRTLIADLFSRIEKATGIAPHSVKITITETSKVNWGIRGQNAEDLSLNYRVDV